MRTACFALVGVIWYCAPLLASNPPIQSGHTIRLLVPAPVQLVSEDVTIIPHAAVKAEGDRAAFDCRFVLRNLSPVPSTFKVGMPIAEPVGELTVEETDLVLSHQMIARDDKNTFHIGYLEEEPVTGRSGMFTWEMCLAGSEKRVLRVYYELPVTVVVASSLRQLDDKEQDVSFDYGRPWYATLEPCLVEYIAYTLAPNKSWKGDVEHAVIRVADGMASWMEWRRDTFAGAASRHDVPMRVGLTYLQSPDGNWSCNTEHGFAAMTIRNYRAASQVRWSWFGTVLPKGNADCDLLVEQLMGDKPRDDEVRELREVVAAFYGIAPTTKSVKDFVERQVWYHPKSKLQDSDLTNDQRLTLDRLNEIANELPRR